MAEKELKRNFNRALNEVGSELSGKNITDIISLAGLTIDKAEKIKKNDNKAVTLFNELQSESLLSPTNVDTLIEDLEFLKLRKVKNILELYKSQNKLLVEKVIEEREKAKIPEPPPSEPIPVTPGKVTDREHKIFISFSFEDKEKALGIKDRIEEHFGTGSCWICTSELKAGDSMDKGIAEAIDKATVLVCLVSQNYTDSPECEKEVELARQQKTKKFLPIELESVKWPLRKSDGKASPMGMAFAQLIYIPLYKDEGGGSEEFEAIIKSLKEMFA